MACMDVRNTFCAISMPVKWMEVVGQPDRQIPIFAAMQAVVDDAEQQSIKMEALERF